MQFDPKDYQVGAIDFALRKPRCYLDASIGSGKTAIALTVAAEMILRMEVRRVLVIAPLNVVLNTFPDEIAKWDHTNGFTYSTLHGTNKDEAIKECTDFHFMNYEGLEWFYHSPDRKWYDMIIIDESHWIKDGMTRRFRYARTIFADVPRIIMMSGTPIGNSLLDLWSQYFLLDRGKRLQGSYEQYRSTYFRKADYMGYKWEAYDWSETAIVKAVSDITYQVHADDVELTELTEITLPCDMPEEDLEKYKRFERDYFVEIDDVEIEAFNAAALATKLRQFANGFLYHDGANTANVREVTRMHDVKLMYIKALVDAADENIMIVATFQEDFNVLRRYFPGLPCIYGKTAKGLVRKRIQAWNNKEFKVMAIHPRSVGIGLNLQDGGCRQIWLSPDWSYLSKLQTVGRLHRTGQTEDVRVEVLVAVDTIDEMVMEALQDKKLTATGFARKLKAYKNYVLRGIK